MKIYLLMKREVFNGVSVHSVDSIYTDYDLALIHKLKKENANLGTFFIHDNELNEGSLELDRNGEEILFKDADEVIEVAYVEVNEVGYPSSWVGDSIMYEYSHEVSRINLFGSSVLMAGFTKYVNNEIEYLADNYIEELNNK